ncbi:hypothetical protein BHE74_00055254 [Ensete ventricosum]|nr:hypothetical protein GW17_00041386 [Ensete ventricosum]RWW39420.1 hypothetical protein BHE74_00055254 [Ensete ventricosum]RZR99553.1 hypothetical protein BHM03_00029115 [Ensete ventricosum]
MMQLLLAVAFSAAPLTLYMPPLRSLNPFVEAVGMLVSEAAGHMLWACLRFRRGFRRLLLLVSDALR